MGVSAYEPPSPLVGEGLGVRGAAMLLGAPGMKPAL